MNWENDLLKAQEDRMNFVKSSLNSDLEKARAGVYSDTDYNRKKGLVGQKYGNKKEEESTSIETFIGIAKDSKDVNDFMNKVQKITTVPATVSEEFFDKYGDGGKLSIKQASENFMREHGSKK